MTVSATPQRRGLPLAHLAWFDPGDTTGMVVLGISPYWLAGDGSAMWDGLKQALKYIWIAQCGIDTRIWMNDKAATPEAMRVVSTADDSHDFYRAGTIKTLEGYKELQRETFMVDQCMALLQEWPRAAWGHESFQLHTLAANLSPIRVAAKIAHSEMMYGRGRMPYTQTAAFAKTTATDERMRSAALYRPGMVHGTDAARHAVTFLRQARKDGWLRAEAWPHLFEQ